MRILALLLMLGLFSCVIIEGNNTGEIEIGCDISDVGEKPLIKK